MSRTYKDTPHWVRILHSNEPTRVWHFHYRLGFPIYRWKRMRDEDGQPAFKAVEYTTWETQDWKANNSSYENYEGEIIYGRPVKVIRYEAHYERVLIGHYAQECSLYIGRKDRVVSYDKNGLATLATCSTYLAGVGNRNRPRGDEKHMYYSQQRTTKRLATQRAVEYYNSQDLNDLSDDDYYDPEMEGRSRLHYGWWL